jgi:hypothetical protein
MEHRHTTEDEMIWNANTDDNYLYVVGKECVITLEPRPHYCDRGNYLAKILATGELGRDLDESDGWPRYYFDLERAKLEIEAWMKKRKQDDPLYEVARDCCHKFGMEWRDPRTGIVHPPAGEL